MSDDLTDDLADDLARTIWETSRRERAEEVRRG